MGHRDAGTEQRAKGGDREQPSFLSPEFTHNRLCSVVPSGNVLLTWDFRLMEPQLIRSLVPYEPASKLEIRVCRIWVTKTIGADPQAASLDSVFVDKEGNAIHATMNSWDIQFFSEQLNVGFTYEINKFRVIRNRTSSKIVPHNAMIELNRWTTIVPVERIGQVIPMQWFNLVEFDQLHQKVVRYVELTDVFGCLMALQPTEEVNVQNVRVAKKRNLQIQNIRGDQVRVTLWAESATGFQEAALKSLVPPVFIALTALKVNQYQGKPVLGSTCSTVCFFNPEIPQLMEYKQRFQYLNLPVEILPSSAEGYAKPHVTADFELKTIEELLLLDPTLNKDTKFMCRATIVGYDLSKGWWYKSCPSCHKAAKKMSADFECYEHGLLKTLPEPWFMINFIVEDNTNQFNLMMIGRHAEKLLGVSCHSLVIEEGYNDSFMLPPNLKKFIGTTKKFQLRFGNQNKEFPKVDFVVCGLFKEQPPSATSTSLVELCTPAANAEKQIVNDATPASFAPLEPCAQDIQLPASNKTTVKRALFVESEAAKKQSKTCEESQPQSTILATISKEFTKPVIPKIEPSVKVPVSALRSRSQTKNLKQSVGDVDFLKK